MGQLAHIKKALNRPKPVDPVVSETAMVERIAARVAAMIEVPKPVIERVSTPIDVSAIAAVIREEIANIPEPVFEVTEAPKKDDWVFSVERDEDGFIKTIRAR